MRPSTSMHAQLRPISPSPPRKTTRTDEPEPEPEPEPDERLALAFDPAAFDPDVFEPDVFDPAVLAGPADPAVLAGPADPAVFDVPVTFSDPPAAFGLRRRLPEDELEPLDGAPCRDPGESGNRALRLCMRSQPGEYRLRLVIERLRGGSVGQPALADR